MVKIYEILEQNEIITTDKIVEMVNKSIDMPVCKSSIEKDLFNLKMDFDVEIEGSPLGLRLVEKIDIKQKLWEYLEL